MSNQLCGAQISQGEVETYPSIRTSDIGIHDRRHSGRIGRGSSLFIVASFLALNAARTERAAIPLLPWNRFESFCAYLSPTSVRRGRFDRFMRFGFRSVQNRFSAMLLGAPSAHVLSAQPRSTSSGVTFDDFCVSTIVPSPNFMTGRRPSLLASASKLST